MKNRDAGFILLGVTTLVVILAWSYNIALANIINTSCSHGIECPMHQTLYAQQTFSNILTILLGLASAYLIFSEQIREKFMLRKMKLALGSKEKRLYKLLLDNNFELMQSELREELGVSKVKMTRLLNRLERKGLIERKRQGLSNLVVLKMKLVS